ncbi:hypothetical protein ACMU_08960 [Actibacterium mucosum KCTC 23349]|uniref:Bacterial sugar transferase domain-containing protein n=1 Tax=Actibacterium mucosum KCTC 23349 TaxID=1454373 RepID=A0A037ZIH4_9RHOB|nr:sugar transferase [Actibacterium mucosum]KAJ55888.1 hypothetical protein ACMU_08960 [Actibacterium mucosum KCTC 23349]
MKDILTEFDVAEPSVQISDAPGTGLYATVGKRVFDVFLGVLALPALVPVLALIWVLIRKDGGKALFIQDRVGKNGKTFRCFKFRTMVENADEVLKKLCDEDPEAAAEWNLNQKLQNDPRITRVGKVLRATSLDELPQIFNVLKGDMSFVGPRPFMVEQQDMYVEAGGTAYFKLRPGITGTWQLEGRGKTSFVARVRFDNDYLRDLTFLSDVKMVLKTVLVVFDRTGR